MNPIDKNRNIRKVSTKDLPEIYSLLKKVQLPLEGVMEHHENFLVLATDEKIAGVVGLEIYKNKGLLRSLAVLPEMQNSGLGSILFDAIMEEAKILKLRQIILLTETAEKFFTDRGFEIISRDTVDESIKESVEFKSVCPASAICMKKLL